MYIQECSRLLNISEKVLIIEVKKVRGEVVAEQKKNKERSKSDITITDDSESVEIESDSNKIEISDSEIKFIKPLEREVIRYCVRYGMCDFCEVIDDNSTWIIKVVDFVKDELNSDNIQFKIPIYKSIFDRINNLIDEFNDALQVFKTNLKYDFENKLHDGFREIANKQQSIPDIEKAEKVLKEKLFEEQKESIQEFSMLYIGNILGSDEDNEIRKEVLDMITDRYQLSKYHSKMTKIEKEIDKLPLLLPRAISELKDGILYLEYKKLKQELSKIAANKDKELVECLMTKMQHINQLRSGFAKDMGERIIYPR